MIDLIKTRDGMFIRQGADLELPISKGGQTAIVGVRYMYWDEPGLRLIVVLDNDTWLQIPEDNVSFAKANTDPYPFDHEVH